MCDDNGQLAGEWSDFGEKGRDDGCAVEGGR